MPTLHRLAVALLLGLPILAGCSRPDPAATHATQSAPAVATAAAAATTAAETDVSAVADEASPRRKTACELVTGPEMSTILGKTVAAVDDEDGEGDSACRYEVAGTPMPAVTLSVSWEAGEAAMMAVGMMGRIEPGIADPYAGVGDQAALVGPLLMVRSGEHLLRLMLPGADDMPAAARGIVDVASGRM